MARTLVALGWEDAFAARLDDARAKMTEAITFAEASGMSALVAEVYAAHANVELRYGPSERALELTQRSLDAARRSGDQGFVLQSDHDVAWALALMGNGLEALGHVDRTTREILARGDAWMLYNHVWAYSAVYAVLGDAEQAARLQGVCDKVLEDLQVGLEEHNLALAERCYRTARALIAPVAWEEARRQGEQLSLAEAVTEAQGHRR